MLVFQIISKKNVNTSEVHTTYYIDL